MRIPLSALLAGEMELRGELIHLPPLTQILDALVAPEIPASWARLTPRERALAVVLLSCAGQTVERDVLLTASWGPGYFLGTLRMTMVRLRPKLHRTGWSIETTPGVGYRLVPPVVDRLTALREMEAAA